MVGLVDNIATAKAWVWAGAELGNNILIVKFFLELIICHKPVHIVMMQFIVNHSIFTTKYI